MDIEYHLVGTVDKYGNPEAAFLLRSEKGQMAWVADTDFGPFDSWLDLLGWWRRSLSVDLGNRFT